MSNAITSKTTLNSMLKELYGSTLDPKDGIQDPEFAKAFGYKYFDASSNSYFPNAPNNYLSDLLYNQNPFMKIIGITTNNSVGTIIKLKIP